MVDRDQWIKVQKKTFTRWTNQYLDNPMEDLFTELSDGIQLANLLYKISGERVGKINKSPRMDIQKLENLNMCLTFLKNQNIELVNIGSSDIQKGNEKLILGLIWTIILRFEVAGADGKQGLLLWVQRSVNGYNGVNVQDFTNSWTDGLAFNALIHRYRPDLLNFDELGAEDGLGNCENAFGIAEKDLAIHRLLDAEDVVNHPDEKSMIAYISQFFKLFAGAAKNEAMVRAIKNAVEVTRRHDEWIEQYNAGAKEVLEFSQRNKEKFTTQDSSSTTEEVGAALDEFTKYMKDIKPEMQAKRGETEGYYTTLCSSKRNNKRPEFVPSVGVNSLTQAWEEMEQQEQAYERMLIDKYLAFQRADRGVSKFMAKAATVETWLDEKTHVFETGELGSSIPEVESHLEIQSSFESRYKLYEKVCHELEQAASSLSQVEGHAGAQNVAEKMEQVRTKMAAVKEQGAAHRAKLEQALENEKRQVELQKQYLTGIDQLDFAIDKMEETVNEPIVDGVTIEEIKEMTAEADTIAGEIDQVEQQVQELTHVAEQISSKRPDAEAHMADQKARLGNLREAIDSRKAALADLLGAEQQKDEIKKAFADKANAFDKYVDEQQAKLANLPGTVEQQRDALEKLRQQTAAEGKAKLDELAAKNEDCENAQVVANQFTSHTIHSLRAQWEQLEKAMKRTDDSLSAQLVAQKSLEISQDQLREMQEIFAHFDQDGDGKLSLSDLREACLGAGIDMDDAELEKKMKSRQSSMMFSLDDFIGFFLDEVQTGDTMEDVLNAFKTLAGGNEIASEKVNQIFGTQYPDLAQYLSQNINDGDYTSFTNDLFTR